MELYLKTNIPEGQRHCVVDEVTLKKIRPGYLIFPTKCLNDIPTKDAEVLLRQNDHILSKKPMSDVQIKKEGEAKRPAYPPDHISRKQAETEASPEELAPSGLLDEQFVVDDEVIGVLQKIAKMDADEYGKLKPKQIHDFAATLGLKLPANLTKEVKLARLNDRCAELAQEINVEDLSPAKGDYGESDEENQ